MTTFDTLVSVSQSLLRANGRWGSLDDAMRRDIRATVQDVSRLLRSETGAHQLVDMAVAELERRAAPFQL